MSKTGYTVRAKGKSIVFKSRGDFDLRRVPALQAMGLSPPEGEPRVDEVLTAPANCPCGAPLPWHLVAIADSAYSHVCRCRNGYAWHGAEQLRYQGKRGNPFA